MVHLFLKKVKWNFNVYNRLKRCIPSKFQQNTSIFVDQTLCWTLLEFGHLKLNGDDVVINHEILANKRIIDSLTLSISLMGGLLTFLKFVLVLLINKKQKSFKARRYDVSYVKK